jgi:hypothetical protein
VGHFHQRTDSKLEEEMKLEPDGEVGAGMTTRFVSTFGNPLACAAMIVRSPGFGFVFDSGVYCLTESCNTSSCVVDVARGKLRIWEASIICWSMRKYSEDILRDK